MSNLCVLTKHSKIFKSINFVKRMSTTTRKEPTVIKPTTKHHASVIFLHGLGGTGMNYEMLVRPVAPAFPHVKIILPSA